MCKMSILLLQHIDSRTVILKLPGQEFIMENLPVVAYRIPQNDAGIRFALTGVRVFLKFVNLSKRIVWK